MMSDIEQTVQPNEELRAEDVQAALSLWDSPGLCGIQHLGLNLIQRLFVKDTLVSAARDHLQCLASQEQTPGITDEMVERAARAEDAWIQSKHLHNATPWDELTDGQRQEALDCARAGLQAALVGFHTLTSVLSSPGPFDNLDVKPRDWEK